MYMEERQQWILDALAREGRVSIAGIQAQFAVSADSARRDLRLLEEKGLLQRTHGGAIPLRQTKLAKPAACSPRDMETVYENYDAIAKEAAGLIRDGDAVYIPGASVGWLMLAHLAPGLSCTVATNSIVIAEGLRLREGITVVVLGGHMRKNGNMVDALAADALRRMRLDLCFLTGAGFSHDFGLSIQTPDSANFMRAVLAASRRSAALFPDSKLGFKSFLQVAEASAFDLLVTDWNALEEEVEHIRELGVEVRVVPKPEGA